MAKFDKKPILTIGMSHLVAIREAISDDERASINLLHVRESGYHDLFGEAQFTSAELRSTGAGELGPSYVFGMPFGNFHNLLGLVESPLPFDFLLDEHDDVDGNRLFLPSAMVEEHFRAGLTTFSALYDLWRDAFREAKFYHVMSPPPVEDEDFILANPRSFVALREYGAADPAIRMKLYRLQCRLIERVCAAHGIQVIHPPADCLNERGFLRSDRATDPTHGNAQYGRFVLNKMLEFARV